MVNLKKVIYAKINGIIQEKQKLLESSCRIMDEQLAEKITAMETENEGAKLELADKLVGEIIGKIV